MHLRTYIILALEPLAVQLRSEIQSINIVLPKAYSAMLMMNRGFGLLMVESAVRQTSLQLRSAAVNWYNAHNIIRIQKEALAMIVECQGGTKLSIEIRM